MAAVKTNGSHLAVSREAGVNLLCDRLNTDHKVIHVDICLRQDY